MDKVRIKLLIIDDEKDIRDSLKDILIDEGYEIHLGQTSGPDCTHAWLSIDGRAEGAASANGQIMGCYLHGLFGSDAFRACFLGQTVSSDLNYAADVDAVLDRLAAHMEQHMDLDLLLELAGPVGA